MNKGNKMKLSKALVVDDSKVVRIKLGRLLETRGLTVDSAESGEEALELLKNNSAPDIIFMDFMMPDMDGYQVTGIITKNPETASIPVVICTGQDSPEDRARAKESGARGFLTKPIEEETLDKILFDFENAATPADALPPKSEEPVAATPSVAAESSVIADIPKAADIPEATLVPELAFVPEPAIAPALTPPTASLSADEAARIAEQAAREMTEKVIRESIAAASSAAIQASRDAALSAAQSAIQEALNAWRQESLKMQQEGEQRLLAAAELAAQQTAQRAIDAAQSTREPANNDEGPTMEDTLQAARQAAAEAVSAQWPQTLDATRQAAENAMHEALSSHMESIVANASHQATEVMRSELQSAMQQLSETADSVARIAADQVVQEAMASSEMRESTTADIETLVATTVGSVINEKISFVTTEASNAGREAALSAVEKAMQSTPQPNADSDDVYQWVQDTVMSSQEKANEVMSEFVEAQIGAAAEQVEYSNARLMKIMIPWLIVLTTGIVFLISKQIF